MDYTGKKEVTLCGEGWVFGPDKPFREKSMALACGLMEGHFDQAFHYYIREVPVTENARSGPFSGQPITVMVEHKAIRRKKLPRKKSGRESPSGLDEAADVLAALNR